MADIKLFSGTSHPQLAQEVAHKMSLPLSKAEVVRFDDSEVKVTIQEDVKDQICVVIQSTCNPTDMNYMELFMFCDALKRCEAKKIVAVIPLFGYARQNTQHRPGECVSLHVAVKFLETVGFDEVLTFDIHEVASTGIFSVPFTNLVGADVLAPAVKDYLGEKCTKENVVMVTPDQEGIERARDFGEKLFNGTDFETATVSKKRNLDAMHQSQAVELFGDVTGKTVVIVDDICTSGGTLIHAAELCLQKGAKNALAAVTHADFSTDAPQKLQSSPIEVVFTTNTIPLQNSAKFDKLKEISVADSIVQKLTV